MEPDFYQNKYFEQLNDRLDAIEAKLNDIQSKVIYMYGFAAAIGIFASFVLEYFKNLIFSPHA